MKKILYIKANPKASEDSHTFKLADKLAEKHTEQGNTVTQLDLYKENLNHLDDKAIEKLFSGQLNEITKYVHDFIEYDEYIVAAPMWNLSIPSVLKTYIDHIVVPGKTFNYTATGPVGLLRDKKLVHVTSRGGFYTEEPTINYEMGDRYLKTIFGFIGISNYETIALEGTGVLTPEIVNENLKNLINKF